MKGRAEGIASKTDPWNCPAAFAQDRIVHRDDQSLFWAKALLDAPPDLPIELPGLKALVRIEPVIGAPVSMELPIGG